MEFAGQSKSNMASLFIFVLLLFPGSISVLCVAPGGHVAIEDANTLCCASSANSAQGERCSSNGLEMAGDCRDCTDLFISANALGPIPESHAFAASGSIANDCLGDRLAIIATSQLFRQGAPVSVDTSPPSASVVPLRC